MKIFWTLPVSTLGMASLVHVQKSLREAIAGEHSIVYPPGGTWYESPERRIEGLGNALRECDVMLGLPMPELLVARHKLGLRVPGIFFMLGRMPRGAFNYRELSQLLTSEDVLLGNCRAELDLADSFFENARTELLPFAYDERTFHPLDAAERRAARARLGLDDEIPVLVYPGRITLEKNVHTVLRVFRGVLENVPGTVLLIAGPASDQLPFGGVGSHPVHLTRSMEKAARKLGLPEGSVRMLGSLAPPQLRECYGAADVALNMTLHHDENFGLSQVEAMACGIPVVGTRWGGLKDTILDGVTGYQVSAVVTPLGVKANWWEAVGRTVQILRDPAARERFRRSCPEYVAERYTMAKYREQLGRLMAGAKRGDAEPLRTTPFATSLWTECRSSRDARPGFRRGRRSWELYQELITPFAGGAEPHIPLHQPLAGGDVLVLSVPAVAARGRVVANDPIYPLEAEIPPGSAAGVRAVLEVLQNEPVISAERLLGGHLAGVEGASEAVAWMLEQGVLLRSAPGPEGLRPPGSELSRSLFKIQRLSPATDFYVQPSGD